MAITVEGACIARSAEIDRLVAELTIVLDNQLVLTKRARHEYTSSVEIAHCAAMRLAHDYRTAGWAVEHSGGGLLKIKDPSREMWR